jgi:hypothetical protein
MAGQVQKAKSPWAPEKSKRELGTLERVEKKKKKQLPAAAGGGMKPPSKPPKGPTGGNNKGPKDEGKKAPYGDDSHSLSMGNRKGVPNKSKDGETLKKTDRKLAPHKPINREGQKPDNYKKPDVKANRQFESLKKSTKKDK